MGPMTSNVCASTPLRNMTAFPLNVSNKNVNSAMDLRVPGLVHAVLNLGSIRQSLRHTNREKKKGRLRMIWGGCMIS